MNSILGPNPSIYPLRDKMSKHSVLLLSIMSCRYIKPLIREAFTIIPPDLQGWVFGHGLDDDTLAILASAKTHIYRYFLGVELRSEDLVWRRTLSSSWEYVIKFVDGHYQYYEETKTDKDTNLAYTNIWLTPELKEFIKQRKLTFAEHVMCESAGETLLTVLEGKLEGKRSRGRRRQGYTDDLKQWTGRYEEMKRMAEE
ncbi:hypothetical protein LAZ67_20000725, partial [Cordylochernes scorpioides]